MNSNLQKNTKNELIEEILKSREELEKKEDEIKDLKWKINTNMTNSWNSSNKNYRLCYQRY